MANALLVQGTGASVAYGELDVSLISQPVYVRLVVAFTAAQIADMIATNGIILLGILDAGGFNEYQGLSAYSDDGVVPAQLIDDYSADNYGPGFAADTPYTIDLLWDGSPGPGPQSYPWEVRVDTVSVATDTVSSTSRNDVELIRVGQTFALGAGYYLGSIKVGTTGYGSSDVADIDFATIGSVAAAFDSTVETGGGTLTLAEPPVDLGGGVIASTVLRYGDPPLWRFIVTNLAGETLTILDKRSSERGVVFTLNAPATITGLVPSDDPEINLPSPTGDSPAFLSHNTRLVYGLRRELRPSPGDDPWHPRASGLVESVEDVGADLPTSRYTAYDPWQYLMSRPIRLDDGTLPDSDEGVTYTDMRASEIALSLLANTIAVDGDVFIDASDAGLIEATDVITGDTKFERGLSVGEAWQQLCATGTIDIILRPIYDPASRPGKLCELVIKKQAGQIRYATVMGWDRAGRSLTDISRLVDGTRLANNVLAYDDMGGDPVTLQVDAASVTQFGTYFAQLFQVGKRGQTALVQLIALAQLQIRKSGARNISFSPAPERSFLSIRDYDIGDYVPVWASRSLREPLGIDYDAFDADAPGASGYQRIYVLPLEIDDDGVERPRDLTTTSDSSNSF